MSEREELQKALESLEAQRDTLGDAATDAALEAVRQKLAALDDAPAVPTQPQRKQVTVLFADVSDFTAMSETMDAEVVNEIMGELWQRLDAVVKNHGGMVVRHLGDALMALWGADTAREDDPEQAIRAALEIQNFLQSGSPVENAPALQMRIGINTGPALLGGATTPTEFNVMGDTVNVASRLEGLAPVGGVLISHDTYRHVRGVFDAQELEPVVVKGKTEPMRVYVVQAAKERAFRVPTRGVEGLETRMVGRDRDLMKLQAAYSLTLDEGRSQLVTIVGEAGVGKSRLLYEFDNWLELRPESVWYFKGRAVPEMHDSPFALLRSLFAFRFEIQESDSAGDAQNKFEDGITRFLGPDSRDKAHAIAQLAGFKISGSAFSQDMQAGGADLALNYLVEYFRLAATLQPVVVLLEDIHWADGKSLDVIEQLHKNVPDLPLLTVCLARPQLFEWREKWPGDLQGHTRVNLEPLSKEESQVLVGEILKLVDDLPASLRTLIADSAEGNPFYVEELVKMLIDDGIITTGEESWRIEPGKLTEIRVPPTLTGVLQARLDGLSHVERDVLQRASVVGRTFWNDTVTHLKHSDDRLESASADRSLAKLRGRELIFQQGQSAFSNANEFIFKHAILRDVTYESVLLKLRRVYHAQVARWLEDNARDRINEYTGAIAGHYEQAGDGSNAVKYLALAARHAEDTSSFREAIGFVERALKLAPAGDTGQQAELTAQLGGLLYSTDEPAKAAEVVKKSAELARKSGDKRVLASVLPRYGLIQLKQGTDPQKALAAIEEGVALAAEMGLPHVEAQARRRLSLSLWSAGDFERAEREGLKALGLFEQLGDAAGIRGMMNNLGILAQTQNKIEESVEYLNKTYDLSRSAGDRYLLAMALSNLGEAARLAGDVEAAQRMYEEGLALSYDLGAMQLVAVNLMSMGVLAFLSDDYHNAMVRYTEGLHIVVELGFMEWWPYMLVVIGKVKAATGQVNEGLELIGAALGRTGQDALASGEAKPMLDELKIELGEAEVEAALARGAAKDFESLVGSVLEEARRNYAAE